MTTPDTAHHDAQQAVREYYDVLAAPTLDDARLRAVLADDLVFEGPSGDRVVGAEAFVGGVRGFVETSTSLTMVEQVDHAGGTASLYDAQMPSGSVRFAEFLTVEDGRISTLRLLFDGHDYGAKGGR